MDDIIEKAKELNELSGVIEETAGLTFHRRGRYATCREHDSLVVDTAKQMYNWNSKGQAGDVITWLEQHYGWDFQQALDWLCERAKLPRPALSGESAARTVAIRAAENALDVAASVFGRWLQADAEALAYALGRGWTQETIRAARLGFSGRKTGPELHDLRGEFSLHGVDIHSPAAVAVLGWAGDVRAWAKAHDIAPQENWVEKGRIPGMVDHPRLVYVHETGGRVRYLSARNLPGHDTYTDPDGKAHAIKSYNLPGALVGSRQPYYNHVYRRDAQAVIVVEGPADAVSLAQWGFPAVALCGVAAEDEPMQRLIALLGKHNGIYVALDADAAGQSSAWRVARHFGPLTRLVTWPQGVQP